MRAVWRFCKVWTRRFPDPIIDHMKKVLIAALVLLVMTACQSGRDQSQAIDESRALLILIQSERNALIATENSAFSDLTDLSLPQSYYSYLDTLPQFSSLLGDYLESIAQVLTAATAEAVDWLFSYIDTMQVDNVTSYYERGYASLTEELMQQCSSDVMDIYLSHLEDNAQQISRSYALLEREARIWRKNLAALDLVGQGVDIPPVESFTAQQIATWATDRFFNTLSENEIVQRGRLMGTL